MAADDGAGMVPQATAWETLGVGIGVVAPLIGRGIIIRRPRMVALAERLDADRRAVHRLQRLRARHGAGPVRLRIPFRTMAIVLDPQDVQRVLAGTPEPFATANREKVAALSHFQSSGVLISTGERRAERRRFNEAVLQTDAPVHGLADALLEKVSDEVTGMLAAAERSGHLDWDTFVTGWFTMVRRVVLGDGARDDHELTDLLADLRADANWAFARPRRNRRRRRFEQRLRTHLDRAEPGSLAELVAREPTTRTTEPDQQVPQWLFAFDAAAMATFRALALLDAHPAHARRVVDELAGLDLSRPQALPLVRATVLESVRLWPTTPAVLRDTTAETSWRGRTLPAGSGIVIHTPFFHRDGERLADADRLNPDLWHDGEATVDWPLIPFSGGPAECAGRNLVLLLTSSVIAQLLERHELRLDPPGRLDGSRPLPGTLSPFGLRFRPVRREVPAAG